VGCADLVADVLSEIEAAGRAAGLEELGVADVAPFERTRHDLQDRKAAGLHAGMFFTYGRPDRSTDPARHLAGARALVVGARGYWEPTPPRPAGPHGRVARYAWRDHYSALRAGLQAVAEVLARHGWRAMILADDNRLVDRAAAYRAGLGWFGKNTNLLLPGRGSWFVLGSVLTDAPLPPAGAALADGCGQCARCQPACPTGALDQAGVLDARRCLAWLLQQAGSFPRELRPALGDRVYGCDDCQTACPPNRSAARAAGSPGAADGSAGPGDAPPTPAHAWVDLVDMLRSSDDELMERHGAWYIPRRRAEYLRRNALLAMANVAEPGDPAVRDVVAAALADPRAVVRAHAVWAARRLGHADLLDLVRDDDDPDVRAELVAPVPPREPARR
jgi:epoxyqueuosine reductase